MGFDTDMSDGFEKMMAGTLLREIVRLNQHTKNMLEYVHTKSKYGYIVAMPYSDSQESFSRAVPN